MESDAENGFKRNDILSQSYAECVERVAQQKNDGQFSFDLPKEVLEEREKVWGNFFDKYADEVSDEVELDMNTMKPAAENEEDEEEDDEEEDEEKECYTKCRAPLRKLPALIQYWIDTGNPPYQLVGDEDATETGSSLSEGEHSRSGHSAIIREISENHKSNTSRCSSVDTAAYILSNTNITKKSETIAIVEGAKSFNDDFLSKTSPLKEPSAEVDITKNSTIPSSSNHSRKSPVKLSQATNSLASKTAAEYEKFMSTPVKTNSSFNLNSELEKIASPSQQSVKLSEILPEIQQFDEMLQRTITKSPPLTRLSLAKNREKPKIGKLNETILSATENSSGRKRLQNRRKLYTGRDSPVDLVVEKTNGDFVQNVRHSLHPALETTEISRDDKVARLTARARRRKRKRASRNLDVNSQDGNTSQESDQKIGEENFKSDARYTDFFESLGLTPSKIGSGKIRVRKSLPKRARKIQRENPPKKGKEAPTINDSTESSMKESADTEDALSPPGKKANSTDKSAKKILGDKILCVRVQRLSDKFLAPYVRKVAVEFEKNKEFVTSQSKSSSGSSPDKKNRSNLGKIELLTTLTHDSDSSTILICSCDNNAGQSDSEAFLSSKNKSKIRRISMRTRAAKLTNKSTVEEINTVSEKLPFVKLEKLNIDTMKIADNLRNEIDQKDSAFRFETSLSPVKSGKKNDLFASNENDGATIDRQIFGESNRNGKLREKSIAKKYRFSLGISISSDEDEDSFEKIISKIENKRDSTKLRANNREKKSSDKVENLSNEDDGNEAEKKQNLYVIATSSDEEVTKRRTRNFVSRSDKNRRKKMTKTMSTLENVEKIEVENCETHKSNETRRSTRQKLSANSATKNQISTTNSCGKSNNRKSLFENSEDSDLKNSENRPPWENRDLNFKDDNLNAQSVLEIFDKSAKAKNQNNKKIVRNSARFQTSIDSDSDTEFEGLRFALNDKYARKNEESVAKIAAINGTCEKQMEIEKTENTRTSPRRNFKNLSNKEREIGEKNRQKRERNLFEETKSLEANMEIEDFVNNGNLTVNDIPANETKDSSGRKKKTRSKREFQEERKIRKKSNSKNDDSQNSPISKKKKLRKIKILGNPMDWESESENDSNQNKIISTNQKHAREIEISRKTESIEQRERNNLFASSPNDTAEDFDALFSDAAKTRGAKKAVIDKLNFSSAKKYKNLSVGLTNLCFKTKLRSDTEDDGES